MASRSDGSEAASSREGGGSAGGGEDRSAFAFEERSGEASSGRGKGGGKRSNTQKLVRTLGKQSNWLRDQASDRVRQFADSGKEQVNGKIDNVLGVVDETVRQIEDRYGPEVGGYARRAADQISSYAGALRDRSVDDLLEDGRSFVRRQPLAAFGLAVVAGLAVARIVEAGLEEAQGAQDNQGDNE